MRARSEVISARTTARLSVYLRCLSILEAEGVATVASRSLAEQFELNSDQIRKDLACFGEFGIRGVGYSVRGLRLHLRQILGLARGVGLVIVGAGRLGAALADYPGFHRDGLRLLALFDIARDRVGKRTRGGLAVAHLDRLDAVVAATGAEIAILAVPSEAAQEAVNRIVASGIRAILNFTPTPVHVPADVRVNHVDLAREVEGLAFFLQAPTPAPAATAPRLAAPAPARRGRAS